MDMFLSSFVSNSLILDSPADVPTGNGKLDPQPGQPTLHSLNAYP
jgi:hypothetical protein